MDKQEVPPGRYRVIYSDMTAGGHAEFSAPDDKAAWAQAERDAYGSRIVQLARVQLGTVDRIQVLEKPMTGHPAVDRAVGALHNYLAAMREQLRRHAELEAAKAAIPADQMDVYIAAAAEIGPRYRDNG